MSPTDDKQARFLRRVEDAAAQYWLMRNWDDDRQDEGNGWKRCYAVDADIVMMYASPALVARRRGNRWGYSEVFRDDAEEYAVALGRRLSDYLFFDLQPKRAPLIIIPPIDGEVISMVNALAARLGDRPPEPQVDFDALAVWEKKARSVLTIDSPKETKLLLEELAHVFNAGMTGELDQFLKISQLLGERRIVPAHSIEVRDTFDKIVHEALMAPLTLEDMYYLAKSGSVWRELLGARDGSSSKTLRLAADAEALARLEFWNGKLEAARWRLIYVTGARHVIEAVEARHKAGGNPKVEVRHPRHFLASPEVVSVELTRKNDPAHGRSQFADLVRTFLADCRVEPNNHMHLSAASVEAAKIAYQENPEVGVDLEVTWNAYMEALETDRPEHARFIEKFKERAAATIGSSNTLESALKLREIALKILDDMLDAAWDEVFRAVVKAGFFMGRQSYRSDLGPSRIVPPIVFERWPLTETFIEVMGRSNGPEAIGERYEEWLEKIKSETGADAYPYANYLAHAALFAGRGHWKVGAIVARRALRKATPADKADSSNLAHGREAAYLAAYCLRHSYRSTSDLDEAEKMLATARNIFEVERRAVPGFEVKLERFDAEALALEMTRLLHNWFGEPKKENLNACIGLRMRMIELFSKINKLPRNSSQKTREKLLIRLASNVVVLSALTRQYDQDFDSAGACLDECSKDSGYIKAIAFFYRAARNPRVPMSEIVNVLDDEGLRVLPYDRARFTFLKGELKRIRQDG
ncbi:MAG: hypothetical protein AB7F36_01735 [Reyranellaceae bacterium]